jgi:hypothetical protein
LATNQEQALLSEEDKDKSPTVNCGSTMFAINHAATALIIQGKFPAVPMIWLLISVQLMELLWVLFNYPGLEKTTTESTVKSVSDIHLAFMPYSHSIASAVILGVMAWLVFAKGLRRPVVGLATSLGILSHLILDLITHAPDIAIAPGMDQAKFGLGLYEGGSTRSIRSRDLIRRFLLVDI